MSKRFLRINLDIDKNLVQDIAMFKIFQKAKAPNTEDINSERVQIQRRVNQKYIITRLRFEFKRILETKVAKMPRPKYAVGDTVRVVCHRDNFSYGWVCLGHPFKVGQDELGIIEIVGIDSSYLEEVIVEDFRKDSFQHKWELQNNSALSIFDIDTPKFLDAIDDFAKSIRIHYEYHIKFENPEIGIKWPIQEKFLSYPIGIQVA